MKVTEPNDKVMMIARIIDPHNFVLWASYAQDRINEGKSSEEAIQMSDYHF